MRWLSILTFALLELGRTPKVAPPPGEASVSDAQTRRALLEQAESVFAFEWLERVLDRTLDEIRDADALAVGLLAGLAAVLAIVMDKASEYRAVLPVLYGAAAAPLVYTLFRGRGKNVPDPEEFSKALSENAARAREVVTDDLLIRAGENERKAKHKVFWVRFGLILMVSVFVATPFLHKPADKKTEPGLFRLISGQAASLPPVAQSGRIDIR